MNFGRKDLSLANLHSPTFTGRRLRINRKAGPDCAGSGDVQLAEVRDILDESTSSTVLGIVVSGPFAGPFVVEIIQYTSMHMRTLYFWNGYKMLRKELFFCGEFLSVRRMNAIFRALKTGIQVDNSTVPQRTFDLSTGQEIDRFTGYLEHKGEPTPRFIYKTVTCEGDVVDGII